MTSSTTATWAGPVRWTADDLLRLSDAGFRFELVKGELVRMAPTGGSHGLRTGRVHGVLSAYRSSRDGHFLPRLKHGASTPEGTLVVSIDGGRCG
jgi:Uma2 family endonuclease